MCCKLRDVFWDQNDGGDTFSQKQVQATAQDPLFSSGEGKVLVNFSCFMETCLIKFQQTELNKLVIINI